MESITRKRDVLEFPKKKKKENILRAWGENTSNSPHGGGPHLVQ